MNKTSFNFNSFKTWSRECINGEQIPGWYFAHALDESGSVHCVPVLRRFRLARSRYIGCLPTFQSRATDQEYNEAFSINNETGEISLLKALDFETNSYYQFTIFAQVRLGTYIILAALCECVLSDMCAQRWHISKTRLYNFDPLKPHFYTVKLGFTGVSDISAQKHKLRVLVRTPCRGDYNEYQQCFWEEIWKISAFFIWCFCLFWL